MVLDIIAGNESATIQIPDPYRPEIDAIVAQIGGFVFSKGISISGLDVRGLVLGMIRGIAGCEKGCPANAKELVSKGYKDFSLQYIEGGILAASAKAGDGSLISFKMFPDF